MLEKFREWTSSWTAKILLGILAATFGLSFGMTDIFQTRHPLAVVAWVGQTEILTQDLRHRMEQQISLLEQTAGKRFSTEEISQFNIPLRVLAQMIHENLLDQEVDKMNLTATDEQIGAVIQKDPHFQDDKSVFSHALFERFLQNQGLREKAYIALLRKQLKRTQLIDALLAPLQIPSSLTTVFLNAQLQKRFGAYKLIEGGAQKIPAAPDSKTLEDFYTQYKFLFKIPEKRSFTFLQIRPKDEKATPDALYVLGKQVDDALASGETLEEVAKANDIPLVVVEKVSARGILENSKIESRLPSKEGFRRLLLDVAFSGEIKADTPVTRTPEGEQFVVRVDSIFPENTPPFQEIEARVREVWTQAQQNMLAQKEAAALAKTMREENTPTKGFTFCGSLSLEGKKQATLPEAVYNLLFQLAPGEARAIPAKTGAYVVQLLRLQQPSPSKIPALRPDFEKEVTQQVKDDLLQAYIQSLKPFYPVKLNEKALQALF